MPSKAIRDFLLTNLQKDSKGNYQWQMNLSVISKDYPLLNSWGDSEKENYEDDGNENFREFLGETLFIKGGNSNYLLQEYSTQTLVLFPKAKVKVISDAGHWVHNEQPVQFFKIVNKFLLA